MFAYSLPKWNAKLNIKALSIVTTIIYILTTLPLLVVGLYNWPSADDMSLALETYRCYKSTGNVIATFFTAFKVGFNEYMSWMGYFFSNVMFCYSPSIFGERWYVLVAFEMLGILTFGVCYFFNALFVKALRSDKHLANIASMLTLTVIVQCMPEGLSRVESFYWYSGAINYMFMFSMALFWLGLMIRTVYEADSKARFRKILWACFWGFWLGGANYMTALQCAICSVLIIVIFFMYKAGKATIEVYDGAGSAVTVNTRTVTDKPGQAKDFEKIWIPAGINLLGFMASCFAPGNATREALVEGFGAVKSIFIAILYSYNMMITVYTRWEILAAAALMIVVSWKMAGIIRHRFQHPFIFSAFAFGLSASNMVPPLYALANLEAGRLMSIIFAEYIVMLMLTVFYVTAWARQTLFSSDEKHSENVVAFSNVSSSMIISCAVFIIFGSALCVYDNPQYYSASAAFSDLVSGDAATYLKESRERLEILSDPSVTKAVLLPYSAQPKMLYFDDITKDKDYWINSIMARYYEKVSVVLGGSN